MKKTTIYLEEQELELLKQKAFMLKTSVAEIIRKSIRALCASSTNEEEKTMKLLTKIRSSFASNPISEEEVVQLQREVRNERKTKSRR